VSSGAVLCYVVREEGEKKRGRKERRKEKEGKEKKYGKFSKHEIFRKIKDNL
jgi:hypothetical protein